MSNTIYFNNPNGDREAHTPGFELFSGIIDAGTLNWDKGFKRAIIDEFNSTNTEYEYQDGYYKILFERFRRQARFVYTIADNFGDICKCKVQFFASRNHKIAQVVNYPTRIKTAMGEQLVDPIEKQVSVGTYCDNGKNEVVVINRFDAIGLPHCNDYSFYSPLVQPLYEKYFSDRPDPINPGYVGKNIDALGRVEFPKRGGGTEYRYVSETPHFHFQSVEQTQHFKNGQATSNAISITKLLEYIEALEQGTDPILYNDSLGMPFLSFLNNEKTYNSDMLRFLNRAHDILKFQAHTLPEDQDLPGSSQDIANFMESLINIYEEGQTLTVDSLPPTNPDDPIDPFDLSNDLIDTDAPQYIADIKDPGERNLANIKRDLIVTKAIIDAYPEEYELIATLSNTVANSINSIGNEKEITRDLSYER